MKNRNQRTLSWRYVRGEHLGRLVSAEPRPVQIVQPGVYHAIHLPVRVQAVIRDHDDAVWVATTSEASILVNGTMTDVTPPALLHYQPTRWRTLASFTGQDGFLPMFAHTGAVWGLDRHGIALFHGDRRTTLPIQLGSPMMYVLRDRQGAFWGQTLVGDIWRSPDARSWHLACPHRPQQAWKLIGPHADAGVWLTDWTRGARRFRATGLWHSTSDHDSIPIIPQLPRGAEPTCVCRDTTGHLWIGTAAAGLFRFDGTTWTRYARVTYEVPFGLPSRSIKTIIEDQQQRMWAITDGGVAIFTGQRWLTVYLLLTNTTSVTVWNDMAGVVASDLDPSGRLWLGTSQGDVGWLDTRQPLEQFAFIPDAYQPMEIPVPTAGAVPMQ